MQCCLRLKSAVLVLIALPCVLKSTAWSLIKVITVLQSVAIITLFSLLDVNGVHGKVVD